MASPWQTSIIIKLMGKQLGYRALQTRLAGIWRPSGNIVLIEIGYGFFIVKFDVLKDYHHALRDGPWFVGDQTSMFKHGRLIFILEQPRSHPLQFGFNWNTYPLNTITMNF